MIRVIDIREISPEMTLPIRREVLRNNSIPINSCQFEWDFHKESFHLGAFIGNKIIGIISMLNTAENHLDKRRLRGMAVVNSHQKMGIGSKLIDKAEELLMSKNVSFIWLKARECAMDFYKKKGYEKVGNSFNIPEIGLHFRCEKKLQK